MKKATSLALVISLFLFLCACGVDNGQNNFEPTTDEEKIAYAILKEAVPDYKDGGTNIIACGPCEVYEEYNGATLVCATLYGEDDDLGIGNLSYGWFDGVEMKEYIGVRDKKHAETFNETQRMKYSLGIESSLFMVSEAVCNAVGIANYQNICEQYATTIACDYLTEFMNYLKNPYTIEVNSVDCYVKPYGISEVGNNFVGNDTLFYFTVNYTAENNLGGKVTTTIGNTVTGGLCIGETSFIGSQFAPTTYYVEDETYAKDQADSFSLDPEQIQEYILENY